MRAVGSSSSPGSEGELIDVLANLEVRIEAYPDLKAIEEFGSLARTLTELEEQISAARRAFNAHVMIYNNLVQSLSRTV